MKNQILIIYENFKLYNIFNEIENQIPFSIINLSKKELVKLDELQNKSYLIITQKKITNLRNQIVLDKFPLNIFKFVEKLNIEFLKLKFNEQSKIQIGNYLFDLNVREMSNLNQNQNQKLKLTEKEISSIIYLSNVNKPVKVQELQINVWGYQSDLETHTVETHIYRLRKKILKKFNDKLFIKSSPNGYQVN